MMDQSKSNQDNSSTINEITAENLIKEITSNIEKSAQLNLEFWSVLGEETPGLLIFIFLTIILNFLITLQISPRCMKLVIKSSFHFKFCRKTIRS